LAVVIVQNGVCITGLVCSILNQPMPSYSISGQCDAKSNQGSVTDI